MDIRMCRINYLDCVSGFLCSPDKMIRQHVGRAVRRLVVQDMPLTVLLDAHGGDLYESGPAAYLQSIKGESEACKT